MNDSRRSTLSLRSLVLLTSLFTLSAASAFAQLSSATLNGVVRDTTGAVIAKATVLLTNVDTGIERPGNSNETGTYVFVDITPGRYTLKVTAEGFSTKQVSAFVLAVNQTATIDVLLAPGAQTEVVTVDASTEQLQTSTAELGTVIATHQVNDLPLNGRNFTQLLSLTPGVSPVSVGQNSMGGRTGGFAAPIAEGAEFTFPSVNGATNRSNYFLTDGMNNFAAFLSTYAVPPVIDAIQEFKVVSRTDTAEFGSVLGGVVNVVTKSGSNKFHGAAWEYIRNDAFDARPTSPNFLVPSAKKPSFRQNQFGASIGGPVALPSLKNNTFFYFAYQGFRFSQPSSANILVPTDTQLTGDFSGICASGFNGGGICNDRPTGGSCVTGGAPSTNCPVLNQIYNPFTTTPSGAGFTRQPFANNIIPTNLIDPRIVGFIKSVYPAAGPFNAENNSNAIDTDPNTQHQNEFNVRIDHTFGQKDSVWFRYSRINSDVSVPASGNLPGLIKNETIPGRNWGASYIHTFSPTLQLQALFSRTTVADNAITKFAGLDAQTIDQAAGFSPDFASNFAGTPGWLIPSLGPGNGIASAGESVQNTPQATDNYQYSVTLTKVKGSHAFKFGGNYITSRFSSPISYESLGFSTVQTNDTLGNGGFGLASALLGVVDNANRRNVNEKTRPGGLVSAFFQDSWKATSNLTINYGLRYDLTLIPPYGTVDTIGQQGGIETGEPNYSDGTYVIQYPPPPCTVRGVAPCIPSISLDASGNAVACDPTTQTCLPPGTLPPHVVVDNRGRISHNTYTNLGPHLGFAYRVGERTVVRGSAGVVYDNWAAVSQMSQNIEGDWPGIGQLIASSVNAPGTASAPTGPPTVFAQDPFAGNGTAGLPGPTPFSSSNVNWYYDPHIKNAYAYQYNFGIQRQLNSSTTVTASYVGSSTRRANIGGMYNTALRPSPLPNPQSRALFPYMVTSFYDRSNGFADYNAFQFQLDKRFSGGLAYQVAYTFSKALTENDGWFGAEGKNVADPYNPRASLSPAGYNLPHILTANVVYELPFGNGKRFSSGSHAVDYVVGNWQVNSIVTIRSGQSYSIIDGEDQANTGNTGWAGYEQANLVGDPNQGSCPNGAPVGSRTCLFNTSAFAKPTFGTFGNVRPTGFQQPRFWNVDASIFRQFPLWSDSRRLEFRAEAFNLFNNVILGGPGNTGNGGDINNPGAFGIVTGAANQSRQLQFGLKIIF